MKRSLIWLTSIALIIGMFFTFSLIGCKEPEVIIETVTETVTETVVETVEVEKEEEAEDGITTVSMSSWWVAEETFRPIIEKLVPIFEQENPDIKIDFIPIPYEQTYQQSVIAVSGGNAPDVIHLTYQWIPPLMAMGALADLTPYFSEEELTDIPEGYLDNAYFGDVLSCSPWINQAVAVLAWKSLLEDAGLPLEVPDTWPEMTEAIEKISALGNDSYGVGLRTNKGANSAFWFFPVLWGFGGEFADEEGNIVFGDQGTVDALDWYKYLGLENDYTPMGVDVREVRNLFAQGKLGFMFDNAAVPGSLRTISENPNIDEDYIVGEFPADLDGERRAIGNSSVVSISQQSDKKDAAIKVVKFFTQHPEALKVFFEGSGALPTRYSLMNDPFYQTDENTITFSKVGTYADSMISKSPNFQGALEFISVAMQEALLGRDTEEIAEKAAASIKTLYNQ